MPIFRSARPYIAAYGFQHLMFLAGALGSQEHAGSVHTARVFLAHQGFSQQHQVLETICSDIQSGSPEDGHSGAQNMLS